MKVFVAIVVLCCIISTRADWDDFYRKDCCDPHDDLHRGWICDDGTRAPTIGCCGNGPCNVFCCNCDGGCRTGNHKLTKFLGIWSPELTPNIDIRGIGDGPGAVNDFAKELLDHAVHETIDGAAGIIEEGSRKREEDDSGIVYRPWRH